MFGLNRLTGVLVCSGGLWASSALGQAVLTLSPASTCFHDGTVVVSVYMSNAPQAVVGGQFFLQYDPSILSFVSAAPGSDPFTVPVFSNTSTPGQIDYAVGVPGGGPGTAADSTMATFTFQANQDVCATAPDLVTFRSHNPPTRMSNNLGGAISATLMDMASIRIDSTPPSITCPPDQTVHTPGTSTGVSTILGAGWIIDGNASIVNASGSGVDLAVLLDAHDSFHASAVRFTPQTPMLFSALTTLSADYNMQCGRFGCRSPHFKIRIDWDGSGAESPGDKNLRITWGTYPAFNDCPGYGVWNTTGNYIGSPDLRFDTSEFPGGTLFDSYSHALSLMGSKHVLRISVVAEETCSAASCTTSCATSAGGRTLLVDNFNINGVVQHFESATATDNCTASPVITAARDDGLAITDPYPTGMTTVTWTATDSCGNSSRCDQVIIVFGPCGSADFNCDGDLGTDADIAAFFACLSGNCPPPPCTSNADFNGDGDLGTDADIAAFFRVLAGGSC